MTIIFDLDGTLLDTVDDLRQAVNHALAAFSLPPRSRDEVASFMGNGIRVLVHKSVGGRLSEADEERAFCAFKAYYLIHCTEKSRPYEGIMPLLDRLLAAGHNLAIVSNKLDPAVKALNTQFFPHHIPLAIGEGAPFSAVEGGIVRRKPCPDALLAVMDHFGAQRSDTIYVGDSEVDIETARRARVTCVSVTWGFRSTEALLAAGATTLINHPSELIRHLEVRN